MVSPLYLVPYAADRELAMGLLQSTSRPVGVDLTVYRLPKSAQYQFTLADVDQLLAAKRSDLAELVLSSTTDVDLLEQVAYRKITGPIARAVCQNRHVPVTVLLRLYQDPRKNVSGAARRALASYLGLVAARSDAAITRFLRVMTCAQDDLHDELVRLALNLPVRTWTAMMAALPQRAQRLPESVVQLLVSELHLLGSTHLARVLAVLVSHGYVTLALLRNLLSQGPHGRPHFAVLRALFPHLDDLSEEERELLWSELARVAHPGTRALMPQVSAEVAEELFARGQGYRVLGVMSGKLSDATVVAWANEWALAPVSGSSGATDLACLSLLGHPAVSAETVQLVLDRKAMRFPAATQAVASNPNLTLDQQRQILAMDARTIAAPAVLQLARSAHVHPDLVQELVGLATEQDTSSGESSSRHFTDQQRSQVLVNLLANDAVPLSVVSTFPTSIVTRKVWDKPEARNRGLSRVLAAEFGADLNAWRDFFTFLPEWEGTLGDLVRAVKIL